MLKGSWLLALVLSQLGVGGVSVSYAKEKAELCHGQVILKLNAPGEKELEIAQKPFSFPFVSEADCHRLCAQEGMDYVQEAVEIGCALGEDTMECFSVRAEVFGKIKCKIPGHGFWNDWIHATEPLVTACSQLGEDDRPEGYCPSLEDQAFHMAKQALRDLAEN